jgi:hypothetical protein
MIIPERPAARARALRDNHVPVCTMVLPFVLFTCGLAFSLDWTGIFNIEFLKTVELQL